MNPTGMVFSSQDTKLSEVQLWSARVAFRQKIKPCSNHVWDP
jgi:hypothetical protein